MTLDQLKKLAEQNALAHGYIFFGENIEELDKIALDLAYFLESKNKPEILVDAFLVNGDKQAVGIDEARKLKNWLWQKPVVSKKRFALIAGADLISLPAQHALLRVSEDPPRHALIIFTVQNPERLLPTIASRFQKIYFSSAGRFSSPPKELVNLVRRFLAGSRPERSKIIKIMTESERKSEQETVSPFLNCLIDELRKDVTKNWKKLREILERKQLLEQYSLNKRLQLEFLNSLFYNSER